MKTTLLVILLNTVFSVNLFTSKDFEIVIERKLSSTNCNLGYLIVNKKVLCNTLELPWENNTKNISCIPLGSYKGILRYDKNDGWRIQLENVPNRDGVQIHMGNYTKQIKGCVLVGMETDIKNCTVRNSTIAYTKMKEEFYGTPNPDSTPNKNIIVTFK